MSQKINCPFSAKFLEKVATKPGFIDHQRIGVFKNDEQIGEYVRNYSSFVPFAPFQDKDGNWFALYSKCYMHTAVMSLPDCKEIFTEDRGKESYNTHFCPVELYVPTIWIHDFKDGEIDPYPYNPRHDPDTWAIKEGLGYLSYPHEKEMREKFPVRFKEWEEAIAKFEKELKEWNERHPLVEKYAKFGFVSGCVFGDDGSWKLEYLDLTDPYNLKRDARFGYLELPNMELKDAICVSYLKHDYINNLENSNIEIAVSTRFNLLGKKQED